MIPQTKKTEIRTEIPQTRMATGFNVLWDIEDSHIDKPLLGSLSLSAEFGDKMANYWSGLEQKHTKMTALGAVVVSNGYTNEMLEINEVDSYTNRLEHFIGEQIFLIPEVEHIFFSIVNDSINVWTIINLLDREVRKRIYHAEYNILNFFRDLSFDFHVACRNNRNINEIHPSRTKYILHR